MILSSFFAPTRPICVHRDPLFLFNSFKGSIRRSLYLLPIVLLCTMSNFQGYKTLPLRNSIKNIKMSQTRNYHFPTPPKLDSA